MTVQKVKMQDLGALIGSQLKNKKSLQILNLVKLKSAPSLLCEHFCAIAAF